MAATATKQQILRAIEDLPEDATVATVWVDLLLSKDQGYFTLLNAAEIPMDAVRAARRDDRYSER